MAERVLPKIDLISEKWVKPSSPTPPSSKYYMLSLFDAYLGNKLAPMAFFYKKESFNGVKPSMELLESSLSKNLDYYYPFAGRLGNDKISIDCNDAGVQLREVKIHASMSEILDPPADHYVKSVVFSQEMYCYNSTSSRVVVQINHFTCGGICVGFFMSHGMGDALTLSNFINDWASIARESNDDKVNPPPSSLPHPITSGASIFPPLDDFVPLGLANSNTFTIESVANVTRRFVFSASSISRLKTMVSDDDDYSEIRYASKVEVVTALIFKSIVLASKKQLGIFKPSSFAQAVNFRSLTNPPLPNHYMGNFVMNFFVTAKEESELGLSRIVAEMKKCKTEVQDSFRSINPEEGNELLSLVSRYWEESGKKFWNNNEEEVYIFTSLCKIPFYQVDFGWGKPIFAFSYMNELLEKGILLMDTPNIDGIEAFITLNQDQMSIFQNDQEFLSFATLNPNICVSN